MWNEQDVLRSARGDNAREGAPGLSLVPGGSMAVKRRPEDLTPREQEILQLLMKGFSYKMIAAELTVSIETIRTHIKRIYEKLHVHSASEAIAKIFPDRKL